MAVVINGTSGITGNTGTLISASTIGVGGATPSASGAGITFPATQSASSDANTLDDYEEGTWTPVLAGSGSNPTGVTYGAGAQVGKYTKVGNVVTMFVYLQWSTYTGGSGNIQISGMPFVAVNAVNGGYCNGPTQISLITLSAGFSWASLRTIPNQTTMDMQQQGSGNGWTSIGYGAISSSASGKEILASVTYFV
jgi:hypothetical protein